MNVLVLAPHPDDEAIGCGGTIVQHVEAGDRVRVAFLTSGELSFKDRPAEQVRALREREAAAAAAVLAIDDYTFLRRPDYGLEDDLAGTCHALDALVGDLRPERILVPHEQEWHPDHRAALLAMRRVAAEHGLPADALLTYEVWTPLSEFSVVNDITGQIERKLRAIRCYASQLETFDYVQAAAGLSQYRGALAARTAYAEVFGHPSGTEAPWPR